MGYCWYNRSQRTCKLLHTHTHTHMTAHVIAPNLQVSRRFRGLRPVRQSKYKIGTHSIFVIPDLPFLLSPPKHNAGASALYRLLVHSPWVTVRGSRLRHSSRAFSSFRLRRQLSYLSRPCSVPIDQCSRKRSFEMLLLILQPTASADSRETNNPTTPFKIEQLQRREQPADGPRAVVAVRREGLRPHRGWPSGEHLQGETRTDMQKKRE